VVQESVVGAEEVRKHLAKYGLETKESESLDGGRLLGIALKSDSGGELRMMRATVLSEIHLEPKSLTKHGLFSLYGQLVDHYPVAGWLRMHCSFLKRLGCGRGWDAPDGEAVSNLAAELLNRSKQEDPVWGCWRVNPGGSVIVRIDASSIEIGVVLEVDGKVVEDASWLRKDSDHSHTNVAELEAVVRGINLAVTRGFKTIMLAIDSLTVVHWMGNTVDARSRIRTKTAAEMLIKRCLGVI